MASQPSTFVFELTKKEQEKLLTLLAPSASPLSKPPPHAIASYKLEGVSLTLYQSGKLLLQGKKAQEWITYSLEPEVLLSSASPKASSKPSHLAKESARGKREEEALAGVVGADETGKGDFFGPLCLCALWIPPTFPPGHCQEGYSPSSYLRQCGVKDSKDLSKAKIDQLAQEIAALCLYEEIILMPISYNALYEKIPNLNACMRYLHQKNIEQLLARLEKEPLEGAARGVMVDQFCKESRWLTKINEKFPSIRIEQETKAERYLPVAAASILARARFAKEMDLLSEKAGLRIPKGAGAPVDQAAALLLEQLKRADRSQSKSTKELMRPWVKWHFSNAKKLRPL